MATKFVVNTKAQVAQASHEREKRQTNVGTNWNEVRIGFIGTMIPVASDDAASVAEDVAINSYIDWACFGLISNVTLIPGQTGCNFIGWATDPASTSNRVTSNAAGAGVVTLVNGVTDVGGNYSSVKDVTVISKSGASGAPRFGFPIYAADGRGGFFALKLVVANKGLSNQTVTVSCCADNTSRVTTPLNAKSTLRTLLTSGTYTNPVALNWFAGGVAIPLPDTWFLRMPFLNNRVRWEVKGGLVIS